MTDNSTFSTRSKIIIAVLIVVAAIILMWLYSTFDPAASGTYFPRCAFKTFTGYDCPGCGSQRAIHALLHGHFIEALRLNALFVVEIPLLILLTVTALFPERFPRITRFLASRGFILTLLATIIIFTIVRNL